MREIIITELTQALQELARGFAHYLPRLIVMLIIAFAGWVIAYLLKVLVRGILSLTKFSKLSENAGATQLLNQVALPSSTELLSRFTFWVAWVAFILLGVSVLGIVGLQEYISRFFLFLPRLLVALVILFLGLLAASFFLPCSTAGGSECKLSVVATVEYFNPDHYQHLRAVHGVRSVGSCRRDDTDRVRDRVWSDNARSGDRVRNRRQGSGTRVPGEKSGYWKKGGHGGRFIASVVAASRQAISGLSELNSLGSTEMGQGTRWIC